MSAHKYSMQSMSGVCMMSNWRLGTPLAWHIGIGVAYLWVTEQLHFLQPALSKPHTGRLLVHYAEAGTASTALHESLQLNHGAVCMIRDLCIVETYASWHSLQRQTTLSRDCTLPSQEPAVVENTLWLNSQHTALLARQTVSVLTPLQGLQHSAATLVCAQCQATLCDGYSKLMPVTCTTVQNLAAEGARRTIHMQLTTKL